MTDPDEPASSASARPICCRRHRSRRNRPMALAMRRWRARRIRHMRGSAKGKASANCNLWRPSVLAKVKRGQCLARNSYRFFFLAAFFVAFFLVAIGYSSLCNLLPRRLIFFTQNAIPAQDVARAVCLTPDIAVTGAECQQIFLKSYCVLCNLVIRSPRKRKKPPLPQPLGYPRSVMRPAPIELEVFKHLFPAGAEERGA